VPEHDSSAEFRGQQKEYKKCGRVPQSPPTVGLEPMDK